MGSVRDMDAFRRRRTASNGSPEFAEDIVFSLDDGRCPGCGARRSYLVAVHDTGTDRGTMIFTRTLPHTRCRGKRAGG